MRTRWLWGTGLLFTLVVVVAACAGGQEGAKGEQALVAEIVTTDLALGPNSFSLGLFTADKELVVGAQVQARFFQIVDDQQVLRGEGNLTPITVTLSFVHEHADGTQHTHQSGQIGVYKANVEFDEAGIWAVEVTATLQDKTFAPATALFQVREKSLSPAIGDPAPRSRQTILSDVGGDISQIDTSDPPNPDMHDMTIAEAVTSGQPTLIVFATPAFCVSRVCGPTKQTVDQLYPRYKDRVNFIHVEPYFLKEAREGKGLCAVPIYNLQFARGPFDPDCPKLAPEQLPPASEDWRLETEPWVFVVDSQGNIAAKFEGVVAQSEIEAALQQVLR